MPLAIDKLDDRGDGVNGDGTFESASIFTCASSSAAAITDL